ncbi:MAG: Holliday junction resolvase RuvX [Gammaproteobacteria bacterium]|nr:Holliday junction resolvase RuvX [Gammaproteobacteria bacterium]MDH3464686.1 Holliday junction resolvase RuvX [Gammaproteobacteria bacterium]
MANTIDNRTCLALDYGQRRIGIAVGQSETATAQGIATVRVGVNGPDWEYLAELIETWRPQHLVVGLPLHMDATESPMATAARRFGTELERRFQRPVIYIDERLTSESADRLLVESGARRSRRAGNRDRLAAQLILQDYFDRFSARNDQTVGCDHA